MVGFLPHDSQLAHGFLKNNHLNLIKIAERQSRIEKPHGPHHIVGTVLCYNSDSDNDSNGSSNSSGNNILTVAALYKRLPTWAD